MMASKCNENANTFIIIDNSVKLHNGVTNYWAQRSVAFKEVATMRQLHTGTGYGKVQRGYIRIYGRIITGDAADAWGLMQHLTNVTDWRRQDTERETDSMCMCVCVCVCGLFPCFTVDILLSFFPSHFPLVQSFFISLSLSACALCAHLWNLFFAYVVIIYSKCWNNRHNLPRVKRVARITECRWEWKREGVGGWSVPSGTSVSQC